MYVNLTTEFNCKYLTHCGFSQSKTGVMFTLVPQIQKQTAAPRLEFAAVNCHKLNKIAPYRGIGQHQMVSFTPNDL